MSRSKPPQPVKMGWHRGDEPAQWRGPQADPRTDAPIGRRQNGHFMIHGVPYPAYAMLFDIQNEGRAAWEERMQGAIATMKLRELKGK